MLFDWDAANIKHIWERHQLRPEQVEEAWRNGAEEYGASMVGGESRVLFLAQTNAGEVLLIVTTERDGQVRPVTARRASRDERKCFRAAKEKR